jgi:hypothetical protein
MNDGSLRDRAAHLSADELEARRDRIPRRVSEALHHPRAISWAVGGDEHGHVHLALIVDDVAIQIPDEAVGPLLETLAIAVAEMGLG